MRADLKALADAVIQAVRGKMAPLVRRLEDLEGVVKELPAAVFKEMDQRVHDAVATIPKPKDGEPGASVTLEDVAPLIAGEVAKAMESVPVPKDGSSVTVDDVAPMIAAEVKKAVAAIPAPKDGEPGRSVTVEDLTPVVAEEVAKAVQGLPAPKDGQIVSLEDVAPLLAEQVEKAVGALPKPKDGQSVPMEEVERMVGEAVAKAMRDVRPPQDGRDALQIELQPDIDLTRSYPRGTYAKHAGGLWRAFEATKGLHGWECIVEGVADFRIDQDGRTFTVHSRLSSGTEVSKSIKIAALVDRGVFKAGTVYEAGDGVTWGGSFFIAQKDGPTGHPGESGSDGWRLAVKRGRDASKGVVL